MANWDGLADFASGVLRSVLIIGGFVVGGLALAVLVGCSPQECQRVCEPNGVRSATSYMIGARCTCQGYGR
jgi:hypothetical protein